MSSAKAERIRLMTLLLAAVRDGDTDQVISLLSKNPSLIDELNPDYGKTVLDYAVERGHVAVVAELISHYNPRDEDSRGRTLIWATGQGHERIVAQILAKWPELIEWQTPYPLRQDVMDIAAKQGHVDIVAKVLAIDPTFVAKRSSWRSAAINGQDGVLRLMLSRNCPMANEATSALSLAVEHSRESTVALLLAERPELVHFTDHYDTTLLHMAASKGNANIAAQLLAVKPELIDTINRGGATVLHAAASTGSPEVIDLFLDRRPGLIDVLDGAGMNALQTAALCTRRENFLKILARCPRSMDVIATGGQTTLHYAASSGDVTMLGVTLALRPEFASRVDNWGGAVLHSLCSGGKNCGVDKQAILEEFLERIWQLNPFALRALKVGSLTPYMVSIGKGDWGTKFFLPKLSWDEIVEAHEHEGIVVNYYAPISLTERVNRLRELARDLIAPAGEALLHPHVLSIVYEYFFRKYQPQSVIP